MRHKAGIISFVGLMTAQTSVAHADTLADAVATAYTHNPTLAGARYDVRASDENVAQARSELRPTATGQIGASFDRNVLGSTSTAADPLGRSNYNGNGTSAQITAVQPLYTGGKATADIRAAADRVSVSREVLRSAEGDLLLGVITAYVDVRRYEATLDVWRMSATVLQKLNKEIAARQIAGQLTRTDVAQADAQIAITQEQIVTSMQNIESASADYQVLVGRPPNDLNPEPPLPSLPLTVDKAFEIAENHNPELRQASYTALASRDDIASARASGRPTISLQGSAATNGNAVPFRFRDQDQGYQASVVLSVPISQGGRIASEIAQAEDRHASAQYSLETTRRNLYRNVSNAWNQLAASQKLIAYLEDQHAAAVIQLDGMISEYRVGLRSTFDVLYAQQSLRDVEIALLSSRRDEYVAQASLLRQAGLLDVETLLSSAGSYNPSGHLAKAEDRNMLPWEHLLAVLDGLGAPNGASKPVTTLAPTLKAPPSVVPARAGTESVEFSHILPIGQPDPASFSSEQHHD